VSTAFALAAVTGVLRDLLDGGLARHDLSSVGVFSVGSEPPDRITTGPTESNRLNLFLYHVTPNASWRNVDPSSRNGSVGNLGNPPLALDLHYLLTAYGAAEFNAEILLGHAMQVLHETPVLTRQEIRNALQPSSRFAALAVSELAEQVELIRISLKVLGTEEISRLWTAFQAHYRPTAAYQASVVLIEVTRPTQSALPVRRFRIDALPFAQLVIESVSSDDSADPRITSMSTIVIHGRGLQGPVTRVRIGDGLVLPSAVSAARISLPIAPLAGIRAGVEGVQVVHEISPDVAGQPPRVIESNVAAFVLRPTVSASARDVVSTVEGGVALLSATIDVAFSPRVARRQRVRLLLNELDPPADRPPRAYGFAAPRENGISAPGESDTGTIAFAVRGVLSGRYLLRVQVDGAESVLQPDGTGRYASPFVEVRAP